MSKQATRMKQEESSEDAIEEALQPIGLSPALHVSPPAKNVWPHWNAILSQPNPIGFPMMKSPEEIVQASKDTINALKKSSAALTDGCGEISQHVMALTHKSVTTHLTTGKEIFDIKTPGDWFEFQSKWAGDYLNMAVSHMTQLSALSTKVINETCEPLKTHFGKMGGFI